MLQFLCQPNIIGMRKPFTKYIKVIHIIIFTSLCSTASFAQSDIFAQTDHFFKKYVKWGQVNYAEIAQNPAELNLLVKEIERIRYFTFFDNLQKAYLINTYNLLVIKQVVDEYPFSSIKNINGFWSKKNLIGGQKLSLEELEKTIILKKFPDPRLHFVLINATNGCPPMPNFAFKPQKLDEQLENQCKKIMENPTYVRLRNGNIIISPIFEWYANDFTPNKQSVINFINKFRNIKVPDDFEVKHYEYDWTLNDLVAEF